MSDPAPLSSAEARQRATTLLEHLGNVRPGSREYGNLATAALAYATLAPQLPKAQGTEPVFVYRGERLTHAEAVAVGMIA